MVGYHCYRNHLQCICYRILAQDIATVHSLQDRLQSRATVFDLVCSFSILRPTVHVTALFMRDMPKACHLISVREAHRGVQPRVVGFRRRRPILAGYGGTPAGN
jgi:hypothetical protein